MTADCSHSVVLLTKDRPDYLARAAASALAALSADGELLIVDDRSKVPAAEVLRSVRDGRMRIIVTPPSSRGVAAARNFGISAARGEVIFFLDDDDELAPDYCGYVLSGPSRTHDYGFSSITTISSGGVERPESPRFAEGRIPPNAPLRKQLCGMGMGFWIRRDVALVNGPFAENLPMNEDTDYVCRLIQANRLAWYRCEPSVRIYQHESGQNLPNLTTRTTARERARCMLHVCRRYPQMVDHLGKGYLRHCAKAGLVRQGGTFIARQDDWLLRVRLAAYFAVKRVAYRLSQGAKRKRA